MSHNRVNVLVHFVWGTWRREELVQDRHERSIYRYIHAVCRNHNCPVVAIGGRPDHVHLLVAMAATTTMSDLMEWVKGGSAHFANHDLGMGNGFAWQEGYGAFSVSPHDRTKVIAYIRDQQAHHASGTVWPEAEVPTRQGVHESV